MSIRIFKFADASKYGGLAALVSVIVNAVLYFIGTALDAFGDNIAVNPQTDSGLGLVEISIFSVGASIVGLLIYWLLYNRTENSNKIFIGISVVVFLVFSPAPFLGLEDATLLTSILLEIMHIVVASVIFFIIYRLVPQN